MTIVCYGEVLVRLSPTGQRLFSQTNSIDMYFGGAETNVAISLSKFGAPVRVASVITANEFGQAARAMLRGHGIDTAHLIEGPGEMGIYCAEPPAAYRAINVFYQRAASSFVNAAPETIDWKRALEGASLLHMSGICPALGDLASKAALRAAHAAHDAGVPISFDGNYRGKLWSAWRKDGGAPILRELFSLATIAFANEKDLGLIFGEQFEDVTHAAAKAFTAFPKLQHIASTTRVPHDQRIDLGAFMISRDNIVRAAPRQLGAIIDRIGEGDAFAAGLLYSLHKKRPAQEAVDFALAACVLKHGICGDANLVSEADVRGYLAGETTDVKR